VSPALRTRVGGRDRCARQYFEKLLFCPCPEGSKHIKYFLLNGLVLTGMEVSVQQRIQEGVEKMLLYRAGGIAGSRAIPAVIRRWEGGAVILWIYCH
jgi:hypothetical protein